ncbi:MAG: hypothetical protein KF764_08640 [Labilithrix sp.]|nr:hypothetical protein [Labilithrix sp.]
MSPPSTPKPRAPRPSAPDQKVAAANTALEQHEERRRRDELAALAKQHAELETWVKGVIAGQVRQHNLLDKRLVEQDVATVSIARAVGVEAQHLPAELVARTVPPPAPPAADGDAKPATEQKPTLPVATRYTRLALAIIVVEAVSKLIDLVHLYLKSGGPS